MSYSAYSFLVLCYVVLGQGASSSNNSCLSNDTCGYATGLVINGKESVGCSMSGARVLTCNHGTNVLIRGVLLGFELNNVAVTFCNPNPLIGKFSTPLPVCTVTRVNDSYVTCRLFVPLDHPVNEIVLRVAVTGREHPSLQAACTIPAAASAMDAVDGSIAMFVTADLYTDRKDVFTMMPFILLLGILVTFWLLSVFGWVSTVVKSHWRKLNEVPRIVPP